MATLTKPDPPGQNGMYTIGRFPHLGVYVPAIVEPREVLTSAMGPGVVDTDRGRTEVATSVSVTRERDASRRYLPASYGEHTAPSGDAYG